MFVSTENWRTWYLGGADFGSRVRFSKFSLQNSFLDKFGLKKSKLFFVWKLTGGANSESELRFLKFQPQNSFLSKFGWRKSKLSVLSKNLHKMVSWKSWFQIRSYIFEIVTPKSLFGQIWAEKAFPVYSYLRPCCCFWTYS